MLFYYYLLLLIVILVAVTTKQKTRKQWQEILDDDLHDDLSHEKKEIRIIVLIFLAHNGISQPDLWRRWRDEMLEGKKCILFVGVNMPKEVKGWKRIITKTQGIWADASLVYMEQEALQEVLKEKTTQIQHFFIVSGDSIPLRSAKHIYSLPDTTQYLLEFRTLSDVEYIDEISFRRAPQWRAYSRWTAERVSTFNFQKNVKFQQMLKLHLDTPWLKEQQLELLKTPIKLAKWRFNSYKNSYEKKVENKENDSSETGAWMNYWSHILAGLQRMEQRTQEGWQLNDCPDEYWIASILPMPTSQEPYMGTTWCKTPDTTGSFSPSPITWNSWDEKFAGIVNAKTICQTVGKREEKDINQLGLMDAIQTCRVQGYLFFRKVSELVVLPNDFKPWLY